MNHNDTCDEGHWVCGCGECACHGANCNNGGHNGMRYSCICGSEESHAIWAMREAKGT